MTLVLVQVLRVWLPSVIFVVGDAGQTPATVMGAFALGCLAIGLVVAPTLARVGPRTWWLVGVVALTAGRLGVQVADGGAGQAATATVATIGGVLALTALAAGAPSGRDARVGVLAGLAGAVALHAALGTHDLAWRDGAGALLAVVVMVAATAVASFRLVGEKGWGEEDPAEPAWPWLALAPMLVLVGVVSGVTSRAVMASGWPDGPVAAILVTAHGLAIAVALAGSRFGPGATGAVGAALVVVGTAIALRPTAPLALAAQCALVIGLGAVVAAAGSVPGRSTPRWRALTAAAAILLFGVALFVYYTAYDIALPFPNRAVLLLAAVGAGAVGLAAGYVGARVPTDGRIEAGSAGITVAASLVLALLVWVAVPTVTTVAPARGGEDEPIRVMLYNLQMGFDVSGRFAIDRQAEIIAAESPDIVVLNEIDRGWLLTGGHDTLRLLADRLGMPFYFAPAADEMWGNALLSRYPVSELAIERLPRGRDAMQRSKLAAVVEVAEGRQLAVVGTHLSHVDDRGDTRVPQARAVAATVAGLRERGMPTVVMGDFNAELDSAELGAFQNFVRSAIPSTVATWPSWEPVEHIDHILVSDGLTASDAAVRSTLASDHLPVVVTLHLDD